MRAGLKILQVNSSRAWGGMEMHLPLLAEGLVKRGHEVLTVCHPQGRIVQRVRSKGLAYIPVAIDGYFSPKSTYRLSQITRRERIDVIHSHYSKDLWLLVPAARLVGKVPVILTKHLASSVMKGDFLHRWIYSNTAKVIANSEFIRKNVIKGCAISPEKVVTIHYGLDLQGYDPTKVDGELVRREFRIDGDTKLVGMVGRFSPGKGYEDLLLAAREIVRELDRVIFLVVGEASVEQEEHEQKIKRMATDLELSDRIIFTGFRRDIPQIMKALDLFVLPSHDESFGLVLIEAMAMGTPVVSTDRGGVIEIVEEGVNGLQVPPKDPLSLARAIITLLKDEKKRIAFGRAGRERVEREFSWERMIQKVENVYYEALGGSVTD